ncbi:MAG TPA: TonB-dependent receptor [Caulobacteraceae bacterium]|nr:TonB-dependent receptor [Caulobacteraceae bacterium]
MPSAVSAVTATQLETIKPRTLEDLSGFAPNVEIGRTGAGPETAAIYIRGLGYSDVEKGQNPAVGVVVDDVVIGTNFGQLLDPYDVAQVEVDRGPAGIFYGKNTTAGVVSVHHTRPTHAWGLNVDLGGGDYAQFVGRFVANAPLGDTAGVKVSFSDQSRDGFLDNIYTHNTHYGRNQSINANVQVDWNITPDLNALLSFTESYQDGEGTPVALGNPATAKLFAGVPGLAFNAWGSPYVPGVTVPLGPWQVANDFKDRNYLDQQIYSLNLTWNSKIGQFVSITAYLNEHDDADQDFDGSCGVSVLEGPPCPVLANPLLPFLHTSRPQKYDQFTEELRFTHDFGDRAKFLAGAYYFHHDISAFQLTRTAAAGVPVTAPFTNQISGQSNDSESVFANLIYNVTDQLHVSGGFRYINESTAFHNAFNLIYIPFVGPGNVPLLSFKDSKSFADVMSKFSVDYALTENNLLYASRSEGFRSGGFSPRSTLSESVPGQTNYSPGANYSSFQPETDVSYEIGSKNTFLDGQLLINVDGFINQDTDHQATEVVLTPGYGPGTNTYIVNLPKVEIKGAELEIELRPHALPGLSLSAVGGWQNAKITNGKVPGVEAPVNANGTAGAPGTVYDLTGTPLERVPNYNFTLRGGYQFDLGPGRMELNADYRWTDHYIFATIAGIPDTQPSFGLVDASIAYNWSRYRLVVSGKNLTNQVYRSNSLPSVFFQGWADPRTVLVELQAHF